MMDIVSLESRVIWSPHWGKIIIIDQSDYCMLETDIQSNVPFIRDALKKVQEIRLGSFKNYSLMGNIIISQPLSTVEVSYQAVQMASEDLDQNIPFMEEYDPVT